MLEGRICSADKDAKVLKEIVTDEAFMKKGLVVGLGVSLLLASVAFFTYGRLTENPPYLSSENGQNSNVDYVAFFGFALGGAGILILLFAFLQWFSKWGPEHGIRVKSTPRHQ